MTSHAPARAVPLGGTRRRGTARRAVSRWAWRMFLRDWRQQALIIALLAAAVAASVGSAAAAYSATSVNDDAEFGAAHQFIGVENSDPAELAATIAAARDRFGDLEVIGHREVPVPGLFKPVDYRSQDPALPLGRPRLALVEGGYPQGGEIALTDGLADSLEVGIGGVVGLDGVDRTVTGIVENPANLNDEFGLLAPQAVGATSVTMLVNASDVEVFSFRPPGGGDVVTGTRLVSEGAIAALLAMVLSTVGLLLVALIAAASFIVLAQRRMRHLAMLAAIGATEKQLRVVTVANGVVVGVVASVIGAVVGLAVWFAVAPLIEEALASRIDQYALPWWLVAVPVLLAIVTATAAAWWPARSVAQVPIVRALSGRPPQPQPARLLTVWAVACAAVGVGCLFWGGDLADGQGVSWSNAALLVAGTVSVALAMLLACPAAIRMLVPSVARLPVAVRLAVGDLARYRSRSAAALAAVSLALSIAVTITVGAAASQAGPAEGNLPADQLIVRDPSVDGPFVPEAAALSGLAADVDRVVAAFDGAELIPLDVAIDPASGPDPAFEGRMAASLVHQNGEGWNDVSLLYLATPRLLGLYGIGLDDLDPTAAVVTREVGEFAILIDGKQDRSEVEPLTDVQQVDPTYGSLPGTFVSSAVVESRGLVSVPSGRWLVQLAAPPTSDQLDAAKAAAAQVGLTIETRDRQGGLGNLRVAATVVGTVVALGIVALMVGLLRAEAGRDLRVLAATGARRRTRRTITASTAGAIGLLGALVGITGAYVGLIAGFAHNLGTLTPVPLANLAVIALGLPALAAMVGWLVSGRDVPDIARQPIE